MEELESICFEILQEKAPILLGEQDIECKEMLELNWACKKLPQYCFGIDRQSLCDWIPDIRHAAVHRNRMTATAACKTVDEAAKLASFLGYDKIGAKLRAIAAEMDWARCEMTKNGALTHKELPKDVKKTVEDKLVGVLAAAKADTKWEWHGHWKISDEVTSYTIDEKWRENPWSDTSYWGQDRNRNYTNSGSSQTSTSPSCSSQPIQSWRPKNGDASTSGKPQAYVPPGKRQGAWMNRATLR